VCALAMELLSACAPPELPLGSGAQTMHAGHFRTQYPNLQGKRILIVEDETLVATIFEDVLLDAGAKVIGSASSVKEALLLIETAAADGGLNAAVLDINLQGAMVSPVADHLAALDVPFVFTTGYGEGCDRGLHSAAPVLAKPFNLDTLVTTVRNLTAGR
jgi:DNA-binding response OmpR family regulator